MDERFGLNLHLFDGAGDGSGAGDGEGAGGVSGIGTGGAGEAQGQTVPAQKPGGRNVPPLSQVKYGAQPEDAPDGDAPPEGGQPPESGPKAQTPEERKAAFEKLIKGDYKDLFDERVQQQINWRFKDHKTLQEQTQAMTPILETLAQKYGVKPNDIQGLSKALEEDSSYYEDEAAEKGMSVEQLKEMKRLERENSAYRQAQDEQLRRVGEARKAEEWQRQADETANVYPNFSLEAEVNHPETGERFCALLNSGIDVMTAFKTIHMDELMTGAIQYAAKATQQRTVNSIRARGMRPSENGASGQAPAVVKRDVSKLTRQDREEISRRVARGETIAFPG